MRNESDVSFPCHLHIQPFQDLENGVRQLQMGGRLAWVGCLESDIAQVYLSNISSDTYINQLKSQEEFTLELSVCFFAVGTFKFIMSCENINTHNISCSSVLKIDAKGSQ